MTAFRPIGSFAAEIVADLRFRRQMERLHRLGPRVTAELLAELGSERSIQTIIDEKVARYAAIDPSVVHVLGGDRFATPPLTVITSADEEPAT